MKQLNRTFRKAVLSLTAMALLFKSTVIYADAPSNDVWVHVIDADAQIRLSVTVPMAFGFVVNGSRDTSNGTQISVSEGTLLLPNFTVDVTNPDSSNGSYSIQMNSQTDLAIKNYSAYNPVYEDPDIRAGLPVTLDAYIENEGYDPAAATDNPAKRAYWEAVKDEPKALAEDFKKYRVSLAADNSLYTFSRQGTGDRVRSIFLDKKMQLKGPDAQYGFTAGGLAKKPSVLEVKLDVQVGGVRGQYSQVEQSVKAGTIYWQISYDLN